MQGAAINKESQDVIEKGERKGEDMQDFDEFFYMSDIGVSLEPSYWRMVVFIIKYIFLTIQSIHFHIYICHL